MLRTNDELGIDTRIKWVWWWYPFHKSGAELAVWRHVRVQQHVPLLPGGWVVGKIFQWLSGLITLAFLILFLVIGLLTKYETGAFNAHESLFVAFAAISNCVAWLIASLSYLATFQRVVLVLLILIFLFINDVARSRQRSR